MADTKPADTGAAAARTLLAEQKDDRDKAISATSTDPSPVPTQAEIDMARLGYPDSGAEVAAGHSTKAMTGSASARHGYETRGAGAAHKGD